MGHVGHDMRRANRPMDQRGLPHQTPPFNEVKELNAHHQVAAAAASARRLQVREAIAALAASDEFIDLVTAKLQASGALH